MPAPANPDIGENEHLFEELLQRLRGLHTTLQNENYALRQLSPAQKPAHPLTPMLTPSRSGSSYSVAVSDVVPKKSSTQKLVNTAQRPPSPRIASDPSFFERGLKELEALDDVCSQLADAEEIASNANQKVDINDTQSAPTEASKPVQAKSKRSTTSVSGTSAPVAELRGQRSSGLQGRTSHSMKSWEEYVIEAKEIARSSDKSRCQRISEYFGEFRSWLRNAGTGEIVYTTFDPLMTIVIVLNICTLGVNAETSSWRGWFWVDLSFASIFLIEICLKCCMFGLRTFFVGDDRIWNVFDCAILAVSITDLVHTAHDESKKSSSSIATLRTVRFIRLGRLLRLLNSPHAKEMIMLMRGLHGGVRTLLWSILLVIIPIYVLGLILAQTLGSDSDAPDYFSTLPMCMYTLVRCMLGDCTDNAGRPIALLIEMRYGWYMGLLYCAFLWVAMIGVFNLISAIFVQNAIGYAKCDEAFQRRLKDIEEQHVMYHIKDLIILFGKLDQAVGRTPSLKSGACPGNFNYFKDPVDIMEDAKDITVNESLYEAMIESPEGKRILQNLDIQCDAEDLFAILDADSSGELDLAEIVEGIYRLRGDAKKSDLVALSYLIKSLKDGMQQQFDRIASLIENQGSDPRLRV